MSAVLRIKYEVLFSYSVGLRLYTVLSSIALLTRIYLFTEVTHYGNYTMSGKKVPLYLCL